MQRWLLQQLSDVVELPLVGNPMSDWEPPALLQAAVDENEFPEDRLFALMAAFRMWGKVHSPTDSSIYPGVFFVRWCMVF